MRNEFTIGEPYFLLHYLDNKFKYPIITSLVFLGKNIEKNNNGVDLWFFQDAASYLENGAYDGLGNEIPENPENNEDISGQVYDFTEAQLQNIHTAQGLINELVIPSD